MKTQESSPLAVIILAAGKGTRMKSSLVKVLHPYLGMPMLWHSLQAAQTLKPTRTVVITGHQADDVEAFCSKHFPGTEFARQNEQRGTGHAVRQAEPLLKTHQGPVVIIYADIMLATRPDVLPTLMQRHAANAQGLTLLTARVENPTGLGRVFMKNGALVNVEEKDCTPEEKSVTTVNPCIYAVGGPLLFDLLGKVTNRNAQNEYYLTDIIELAHRGNHPVIATEVACARPELGMNSRAEIAAMENLWQQRKRSEMMAAGVTLTDPATVWFSVDTEVEADVTIGQNVVFGPGVRVEGGAAILPFCHLEGATIRSGATVGPFARLRPTTEIGENAHIGNFVEIKNSRVGAATKAGHLSYVGDATVGADVNFGAGTITANYNKKTGKKSRTVIGSHSSLGSHTVLVAPVTLAPHTTTGAGTVVRADTEAHSLVVSQPPQKVKPGYSG